MCLLCFPLSFSLHHCNYGLTLSVSLQNGVNRSRIENYIL
ncbi:hypothetical protein mEp044_18 [Escherichia phage mEp044]